MSVADTAVIPDTVGAGSTCPSAVIEACEQMVEFAPTPLTTRTSNLYAWA